MIVTACSKDNAQGTCYPLYGYAKSGSISALKVNLSSWINASHGYTQFKPGVNQQLMIDTSTRYYKSLGITLLNGTTYPQVCYINQAGLKTLTNRSEINIYWPKDGIPSPCQVN